MVLNPTAVPDVAKPESIIEKINKVGKQSFFDERVVPRGRYRISTFAAVMPLDGDIDLQEEWNKTVGPLIQKGVVLQELARADVDEDPGDNHAVSLRSESEIRIDRITP